MNKDKNIIIVSDEMYSEICYSDGYYSIAQFEQLKERVIVVSGFSKIFSMTGLRIGYVCACSKYMNEII